eukprot:403331793
MGDEDYNDESNNVILTTEGNMDETPSKNSNSNIIDDSSSSRSKGNSKTLVQQDKRKKTMWAQRVSKVGTEIGAPLLTVPMPETGSNKKKRVRARVRAQSKNNSILEDSVDQFLRDEQIVHQGITISQLEDPNKGLESIQEETKEGDEEYKNTRQHRKTSSLIQIYNKEQLQGVNDKQIIIVNNINVTNTNVTTTQVTSSIDGYSQQNSEVQSTEKKHRKITIRKRNDDDSSKNKSSRKPPLAENKVQSDEFMSVDLANPTQALGRLHDPAKGLLASGQSSPKKIQVRSRRHQLDSQELSSNASSNQKKQNTSEFELEFDDPNNSSNIMDDQRNDTEPGSNSSKSSNSERRKSKRVKVNVNKRMTIKRPTAAPETEQTSVQQQDNTDMQSNATIVKDQEQQIIKNKLNDENVIKLDESPPSKQQRSPVVSPKKQQQQPKDQIFDIMREIEEDIKKQKLQDEIDKKRKDQELIIKQQEEQKRKDTEDAIKQRQLLEEQQRKEIEDFKKELEDKVRQEKMEKLRMEQERREKKEKQEQEEKQKKEMQEQEERYQKEQQEKEERLKKEKQEQARIEMEEILRIEREFQENKKKEEEQEQLKIIKERDELLTMLGMNSDQKQQDDEDIGYAQQKMIKKQNTFTQNLVEKNTVQFEQSADSSMNQDIMEKSPKAQRNQSAINLNRVDPHSNVYEYSDLKRPTFGLENMNNLSPFQSVNESKEIQNILEDSFFRDPLKKNLEQSPLKNIEKFTYKPQYTRNNNVSPSGTPSFNKMNQSLASAQDQKTVRHYVGAEEITTFKDKLKSPNYKVFNESPLKADHSPDNFSPSQFNPSQSQFNKSIESGTISLKSSPTQKKMMDQFNASRDINKTTNSFIMIDSESVSYNNQQTDNYYGSEAPKTERNRKSSRNQFAVSNKHTPISSNKLPNFNKNAVQQQSISPARKPREYTTRVVLDDDEEDQVPQFNQRINSQKYDGSITHKQSQIQPFNSKLGMQTPGRNTNIPSKSPLRGQNRMNQNDQTKSQVFTSHYQMPAHLADKSNQSPPTTTFKMNDNFMSGTIKSDSPSLISNFSKNDASNQQQQKKPIIQNKEKKIVKVILDDDEGTEDGESSTMKTFSQLLKTPSDSICDSFHEESKYPPKLRKNTTIGKSQSNLHGGAQNKRNGPVGQISNNPKINQRNMFESQINLRDMGNGELSPINPRKSYLIDKNKTKLKQPTKITETDPQQDTNKINEKDVQQSKQTNNQLQSQQNQDRRNKASKPSNVKDQFKHHTRLW